VAAGRRPSPVDLLLRNRSSEGAAPARASFYAIALFDESRGDVDVGVQCVSAELCFTATIALNRREWKLRASFYSTMKWFMVSPDGISFLAYFNFSDL
jgi:hypothetical protein